MKEYGKNDRMAFGKHAGVKLIDVFYIDLDYLVWCIMNLDICSFTYELREMAFLASPEYIKNKYSFSSPNAKNNNKKEYKQKTKNTINIDIYKQDYRKLCKFAHPDVGGNTEIMQIINNWYNIISKI